jgi:hypothetical protein
MNTETAPKIAGDRVERDFISITWQRGLPPEVGINGCRVEHVIAVAIERLDYYQNGTLACPENEDAIQRLKAAKQALEDRKRRRISQGVYDTMLQHEFKRTEDDHDDFSATGA